MRARSGADGSGVALLIGMTLQLAGPSSFCRLCFARAVEAAAQPIEPADKTSLHTFIEGAILHRSPAVEGHAR